MAPSAVLRRLLCLIAGKTRVMLDCGAFTAFNAGRAISARGYFDFCKELSGVVWNYVQLDVVWNAKATRENLNAMVREGLKPMPVLTVNADENDVLWMEKINRWICVAGGPTQTFPWNAARFERLHRITDGRVKIHGLGFTPGVRILRTKVASVDSSSWSSAGRYGKIGVFTSDHGVRNINAGVAAIHRQKGALPDALIHALGRHKLAPDMLKWKRTLSGQFSINGCLSMLAWLQFQRHCEDRGVFMFLALSTIVHFATVALVLNHTRDQVFDFESAGRELTEVLRMARSSTPEFVDYFHRGAESFNADWDRCRVVPLAVA